MESGRWDSNQWTTYTAANVSGKTRAQVFTSDKLKDVYNPAKIQVRESRDSIDNPRSTPIILASDVTGSMGMIAETLMRNGLNTLATEIYSRKPVSDPHIMVMAVGDAKSDKAPLQMTQFEADISLAAQVTDLWLEGNGGGNNGESYSSVHFAAATKIVSDSWEKRAKKGFLFTIGDEPVHDGMKADEVDRVFGGRAGRNLSAQECVDMALKSWEVFHIVLKNEGYARSGLSQVLEMWNPILPQRVILLDDYTKLAEVVVSTIQVVEGANKSTVASSWTGDTSLVVANAIQNVATQHSSRGVVRLA